MATDMIARGHKTTLFDMFLQFISRGAQCVSALFWLIASTSLVVRVTRADPLAFFYKTAERKDHTPLSPCDLEHLKAFLVFLAFLSVVMFVISIAPRRFICVNTVGYYCVLFFSSVPGLGLLWPMLGDFSAHPVELTMFHWCCFVMINMIGFSLPLSLVASRLALRKEGRSPQT